MSTTLSRFVIAGTLFVFIFLSGFWLSRSGKPYSLAGFNLHKFIALGAVVFLAVLVGRLLQATPLDMLQKIVVALTALCFIATMVTGGLASIDRALPLLRLHQVLPYLTLVSSAVMLYVLLVAGRQTG